MAQNFEKNISRETSITSSVGKYFSQGIPFCKFLQESYSSSGCYHLSGFIWAINHLWKLHVTFYVVNVSLLLHKKWHVTFRGKTWLKWTLITSRWRIWPWFAERNQWPKKFSNSWCALRFSALTQFSAQFQVTKFLFYINKTLNLVNSPGLVHNFWVTKKCTKSSDHCTTKTAGRRAWIRQVWLLYSKSHMNFK